jgi:hypothetical protein
VIPNLVEVLKRIGVGRGLAAVVFVAFLTVLVLLAPSVARWFDKRNP